MDDTGGFRCEFLFEMRDESRIFLNDRKSRALVLDELGESAEPRADLDNVVGGLDIKESDDGTGEILIVQEILAEAAGGRCLQVREGVADFSEGHAGVIAFFTGIHKTDVKKGRGGAGFLRKLFTGFPA